MTDQARRRRRACRTALAAALAATVPATAALADYPSQPVRVVVPFGPGGTTDLTARAFQRAVNEHGLLPEQVVVVNVTGGAVGAVGSRSVLSADPDGHTLLIHHLAMMSGEVAGTLDFSWRDFTPVAGTTDFCHVLVVDESSPYQTLDDFLTAAAETPDTILYGANLGGNLHMVGLMLEDAREGADLRIVQIGGEAENIAAIKGDIIQATTLSTGTFTRYRTEGLRALAAFSPEREPGAPDVPTAAEQGVDVSFCVQHWWFAPPGTPDDVVEVFAGALESAMEDEELQEFFLSRDTLLTFDSGSGFHDHLSATFEAIAPVAERASQN